MARVMSFGSERRLRYVSVLVLWVAAAVAWLNVSENRSSRAGLVGAFVATLAAVVQSAMPALRRWWSSRGAGRG